MLFSGILLIGVMACLSGLNNYSLELRLGMVALFTNLFAADIELQINVRSTEASASTAAYTAVLSVYVSVIMFPSS